MYEFFTLNLKFFSFLHNLDPNCPGVCHDLQAHDQRHVHWSPVSWLAWFQQQLGGFLEDVSTPTKTSCFFGTGER